jgi:hypothetical protein
MDPSTEYKKSMTKKSKSLTHEQRRVKDRAGTISRSDRAILPRPSQRYVKSWNKKGKRAAYAVEGIDPATGRPVGKSKGDESEY